MSRNLKVLELLDRAKLDALETYVREKKRTVDEVHVWIQAEGYTLSRVAAWNWLTDFEGQLMSERMSQSGELARAMTAAAQRDGGFDDVANAALLQLLQVTFEQASQLDAETKLDPLEVMRMTRSLRNLIGGKAEHTKALAAKFDREIGEKQKKRAGGVLTKEDIAEAKRLIFGS